MSALGLNSTRNYPSVNILPAQRSILIADSKYRRQNEAVDANGNVFSIETKNESPYSFQANFSAAIVGKQIIYQKLYWNQPIFSHSDDSVELRFQINGDDTITYVVYAVPFVMYNQYDGNPAGIPWAAPQPFSYASMMELGFNGDVRLLNSNLQLTIPPPPAVDYGWLYDADGFQMTVYFRYSPVQGFSISFAPSINPNIPVYTIRLLPCSYIANAHFVHGFGIFDKNISETSFVPRDLWTVSYFSDDTPNLLPFRYITVRSSELTKDRRMISFQNANANRFNNEIAIIALSPVYTGTYHTENVGDDATVISKRDDYQPSTVRIVIADETGAAIQCDDPISNLLQIQDVVNNTTKNSFLFGSSAGRGNADFVNAIVFGVQRSSIASIPTPLPVEIPQSNVLSPLGMVGYNNPDLLIAPTVGVQKIMSPDFWSWWQNPTGTQVNLARQVIPIIVTPTGGDASFPPFPDSYVYAGFNSSVTSQNPFEMFGSVSNNPIKPEVSVFTWDPVKNRNPSISLDARCYPFAFAPGADTTQFQNVYIFIIGYSHTLGDVVLATSAITGLSFFPVFVERTFVNGVDVFPMTLNPAYTGLSEVQNISFFFTFQLSFGIFPNIPGTIGYAKVAANFPPAFPPAIPMLSFINQNLVQVQGEYVPPASDDDVDGGYEFGNPHAIAKCEELIHELAIILDKN